MAAPAYPVVRLNPKANARAIRHGFPWAYDNEMVTDRRTRALPPGAMAVLQDGERRDLALVTVNPASRIFARVIDRDPAAVIDRGWLEDKLTYAQGLRTLAYDQPFYRMVHAEGDGLPGLVIDRFGTAFAVQPNAAWADGRRDEIADILVARFGARAVVLNGTGRSRKLEGLVEETRVLAGALEGPVPVSINGATYMADLLGGQKTGLYYDQRPNQALAAHLSRTAGSVLDVFCHVGGFSLACLVAGAERALAVDSSGAALDLAGKGAEASGVADRFETRQGDAFAAMEELAGEASRFDTVICDPPAFAPNRQALQAGLRAYERVARLAAGLAAAGGILVLCSCSHAADLAEFRAACTRGIGKAGRAAQLIHTSFAGPDHPQLPQLAESGYLKALTFRLA